MTTRRSTSITAVLVALLALTVAELPAAAQALPSRSYGRPSATAPRALAVPTVRRKAEKCYYAGTMVSLANAPAAAASDYEVQVRLMNSPPRATAFPYTTVRSWAARRVAWERCAAYSMRPGGAYRWRMRRLTASGHGPWSVAANVQPFYFRPEPVDDSLIQINEKWGRSVVRWVYRGDPGGAPIEAYRVTGTMTSSRYDPRPNLTCTAQRYRCTVGNLSGGRWSYTLAIQVFNGHSYSTKTEVQDCGDDFWFLCSYGQMRRKAGPVGSTDVMVDLVVGGTAPAPTPRGSASGRRS